MKAQAELENQDCESASRKTLAAKAHAEKENQGEVTYTFWVCRRGRRCCERQRKGSYTALY